MDWVAYKQQKFISHNSEGWMRAQSASTVWFW